MGRWPKVALGTWIACSGAGLGLEPSSHAQSFNRERDVTITGPGGRTIERRMEIDRGPGYSERRVQIQRPGGTYSSDARITAGRPAPSPPPTFHHGGPNYHHGFGFGPRPPVIIERNNGFGGAGAFALGMLGGAAMTAPIWAPPLFAPPVVAAPPVVVAAPPVVVGSPAVVVQQPIAVAAVPATPVVDPLDGVALAAQRLQSHYPRSRREAAQTLGRLGDPRGVPPLIDALKNDWFKDVRIACAQALGEIGGPEAETALEREIVYEKKEDVRNAAAAALNFARQRRPVVQSIPPPRTTAAPSTVVDETPRPSPRAVPPPPEPGVHHPLQWKAKTSEVPALEPPAD